MMAMLAVSLGWLLAAPAVEASSEPVSAEERASAEEPVSAAPLDDEVPEPAGLGLQRRELRRMSAATSLELGDLWADYEEDVEESGESRPFAAYVAGSYRVRRGLGIGVTALGTALLGSSGLWAFYAATADVPGVPVFLGVVSGACVGAGVATIVVGARIWRRNKLRLDELRGAGFLAGGPRWGLRAAGPALLRGGAGLAVSLAF